MCMCDIDALVPQGSLGACQGGVPPPGGGVRLNDLGPHCRLLNVLHAFEFEGADTAQASKKPQADGQDSDTECDIDPPRLPARPMVAQGTDDERDISPSWAHRAS